MPLVEIFCSVEDPESDLAAVFEDDGRVAYAYLVRQRAPVADVWVYNRHEAPEAPEWTDRAKAPFLNPRPYVREDVTILPAASENDIAFEWHGKPGARTVRVLIRGVPAAELALGMRPGRSALARIAGPLALPLDP